jgi:hypothetical protein
MSEVASRRRVNKNAIIVVLAEGNPKRTGTLAFQRFELYQDDMTVAQYLELGGRSGDIAHDVEAGYISISE